jgi:hypothetical protein
MGKISKLVLSCVLVTSLVFSNICTSFRYDIGNYIGYNQEVSAASAEVLLASYNVYKGNITLSKKPKVSNAAYLKLQSSTSKHKQVWTTAKQIIPSSYLSRISKYEVFSDGRDGTVGYVTSEQDMLKKWILSVDLTDAYTTSEKLDEKQLTYIILHEFAHILTLSYDQIDKSPSSSAVYRAEEGYAKPKSYLNLFYQRFWKSTYNEWKAIDSIEDDDMQYAKLSVFLLDHASWFVSDYAVYSPEEDLAETWLKFVSLGKPSGKTIAEKKILFFYEFPELVKLRNEIRSKSSII